MARYGSERIRGHGIPEDMEAILIGGSRIEPKVALLKPLSSALSIGTDVPFGAADRGDLRVGGTHDMNMLLPLLFAVTLAHAFTFLTQKRSILTEKVTRRGYH